MNQQICAGTKDLLPAYLAESLSELDAQGVRSHLATCEDCRSEAELIGQLRLTTPAPRSELSASLREGVRSNMSRGVSRRWWMAAAATVVFALGTGLVWDRIPGNPAGETVVAMVAEQVDSDFWPGDETLIAGGIVWDDLSEEEMTALLEDWDDEA